MDNFAIILAVSLVLILLAIYSDSWYPKENLISEMDYRQISRGLNRSNVGGYYPTMMFLSEVDHSKTGDYVVS